MEYELRAGDELVATTRFRSSFGSFAEAESAEGRWTFKRVGFWRTKATIRVSDSDVDLATFKNNTWSGGGTLETRDGQVLRATTNFWQTALDFETEDGQTLIRFKTAGVAPPVCDHRTPARPRETLRVTLADRIRLVSDRDDEHGWRSRRLRRGRLTVSTEAPKLSMSRSRAAWTTRFKTSVRGQARRRVRKLSIALAQKPTFRWDGAPFVAWRLHRYQPTAESGTTTSVRNDSQLRRNMTPKSLRMRKRPVTRTSIVRSNVRPRSVRRPLRTAAASVLLKRSPRLHGPALAVGPESGKGNSQNPEAICLPVGRKPRADRPVHPIGSKPVLCWKRRPLEVRDPLQRWPGRASRATCMTLKLDDLQFVQQRGA